MAVEEARQRQRRGTEQHVLTVDEVPLEGEFIVSTDTGRVRVADGITPTSALPYLPPVDAATNQLPNDVRAVLAANLTDPGTPEGSVLAQLIAAAGGGGSVPLSYDPASGMYTVPDHTDLTYDPASGFYSTN